MQVVTSVDDAHVETRLVGLRRGQGTLGKDAVRDLRRTLERIISRPGDA